MDFSSIKHKWVVTDETRKSPVSQERISCDTGLLKYSAD